MKTRNAVMEGRFYPSTRGGIFEQIRRIEQAGRYPDSVIDPSRIFGAILPHAGHIYSGYQTIPFFHLLNRLEIHPETFILVHPNHSGQGLPMAVDDSDAWRNSIGDILLDRELATALELPFDGLAHAREHSAEVIVPYMQYYSSGNPFRIVAVCMMDQSHTSASLVAERILQAVHYTGRSVMVLASCDFSHFLSPEDGRAKDQLVMERILARDTRGVESTVTDHRVSVCGYGPIMTLMAYAGAMDPDYKVEILARGHSGEVHPSPEVVDYISMVIFQ